MEKEQLLVRIFEYKSYWYDHSVSGWGSGRMPVEMSWTADILDHFVDIKHLKNYDTKEWDQVFKTWDIFERTAKGLKLSKWNGMRPTTPPGSVASGVAELREGCIRGRAEQF